MNDIDFKDIAPKVGIQFLGKPTKESNTEIRWGTHGSWCLNLENGLFYSFELDEGGGVIWLIEHFNQNPKDILNMYTNNVQKEYRKYTYEQMQTLAKGAEVILKYSDSFVVMRFPEKHYIKQKYAPFSLHDGIWYLKRPEGQMPIYYKEGTGPVLISEGEKAVKGSNMIYDGPTATWHGGVNAWDKSDWSPIFGKDVVIWPDNDEAGKKCAKELASYLIKNKCNVSIAQIPKDFNEKDDLWDAYKREDFTKEDFIEYIDTSTSKASRGNFNLRKISTLIENIQEPEWLIEDIFEKDSVIDIYGAPKSGKSFISIDMALCVSLGIPWFGHNTVKTPIIYLAGEGQRGIVRRVKAWEQYYNNSLDNADLFVSDRGVRFLDEKDHNNLIEHIYDIKEEFGDIGCIFVDTLARNFGGGNENSTEDMNRFIERVDTLKTEFNCCIALIHHTGHNANGRARGSSVLPAAVDAEFAVKRKDNEDKMQLEFIQTLIKDGKPMPSKFFEFKEVELLGYDGLTSGLLVEISKEDLYEEDTKIDETISVITQLQEKFAKEQETDPINVWIRQQQIIDASDISESAVKQRLRRLRAADRIYYKKGEGYQSKLYDNID